MWWRICARSARTCLDAAGCGITPAEAAYILWTYSSPELYELLAIRRGWSAGRYGRFVAQALIAALLPAQDSRTDPPARR